jgi:excisionase family DNA binding protein
MSEKLTLSIAEVSDLTGIGRDQITAAIVRGELPAKAIGPGQRYKRVLRKDIEPWLDSLPEA